MAATDIKIGDTVVKSGDLMVMCYGSANRDPEQFENLDQFDVTRADNRPLSFAQGIHYCLGASLARIEGQIAINSLVSRMPNMKMESANVDLGRNLILWGLKSLPITF